MQRSPLSLPALLVLFLTTLASAYRPVQFVKHTGESGRADQAFSLVNSYNESSQQSDLYVRMEAFRYKSEATGWASLALGPQMKGALMFIIYGDPAAADNYNALTLTVRTADGHHPPRPVAEMKDFYSGPVPEVDVVSTRFEEYTGDFYHEELKQKPSHLGIAEFVVRGFERWAAADLTVSNTSAAQSMIWSSNFQQDFGGDFSQDRNIDMHQFGLGFGFLWVDLLNAATELPFFGPINELDGHRGVSEVGDPAAPTADELSDGEAVILRQGDYGSGTDDKVAAPDTDQADKDSSTNTPGADTGNRVEEPVKSPKQWNIRSWMWHIHGFLMTLGFLFLYPLGIYMLRSPRATAFNLHWTLNSLGSVSVGLGALIGFVNSHSISITHQYVGILIVCGLAVQTVLGWRHHVVYVATHGSRTWMSTVHVIAGRLLLPLGMLNVVTGLLRRQYGWLTVGLTIGACALEIAVLTIFVLRARNRRIAGGPAGSKGPNNNANALGLPGDEAEEYFQLTGDDDDEDDAFADLDDDADEDPETLKKRAQDRARRDQEREDQRARLAKLDRV